METIPSHRTLRVFAFDPSRRARLGNHMTVRVPYEALKDGLSGNRVEVIDYDASNNCYYTPVDLNAPAVTLGNGLAPTESDPRFHQQMVYAVAMETIRLFESALGRDIRWNFPNRPGQKLRIFPHAMYEPNAFYNRDLGALLFGYFRASADDDEGIPGQTVFTCLSHDIIAHETTHAVVDSLRSAFMEPTNPHVIAFHEAFADIVALFQHFSFEEVLVDTIQRTGGVLHRMQLDPRGRHAAGAVMTVGERPEDNPLLDLARQFGESMGRRKALRSALSVPPDRDAVKKTDEPHLLGAVLVAAVFDAYFTAFMTRTADLFRIARSGGGHGTDVHPDLARRLAAVAAKTAQHFVRMCIRALDYCPPVDITFGEFLRALITADSETYPIDKHEYREALIEAFRARGIYPGEVSSLAEDALRWKGPEEGTAKCDALKYSLVRPDASLEANRARVEEMARKTPRCFGLCEVAAHDDVATKCDCRWPEGEKVVRSINAVVRSGEDRPRVEFIVELLRTAKVQREQREYTFSGGSTVVLRPDGTAKFVIGKGLRNKDRRDRQEAAAREAALHSPHATYGVEVKQSAAFAAVHRGY